MVDHNTDQPLSTEVRSPLSQRTVKPTQRFILLAANYEQARMYCERRHIDPRNPNQVIIVTQDEHAHRIRGLDHDTPVFELPGVRFGGVAYRDIYARFPHVTLAEL